jgi:hypothetical protein
MREYDTDGWIIFKSMEQRFKNEFYTVVRTLMRLVVPEGAVGSLFQIRSNLDKKR